MKKYITLSTIAVGTIAVMCWLASSNSSPAIKSNTADNDLLLLVQEGCKNAVSSITSGKGTVTVESWRHADDGRLLETKSTYEVAFAGSKCRVSTKMLYVRNEPADGSSPEDTKLLIPPGTILQTDLAYDGQKIQVLKPTSKTAIVGNTETLAAGAAYRMYRREAAVLDHGIGLVPLTAEIVGREIVDGDECIVLEAVRTHSLPDGQSAKSLHRCWVNPTKGFTMPRFRAFVQGDELEASVLVDEFVTTFRQYGDDVWGPSRFTHNVYRPSKTGEIRKSMSIVVTYDPEFQLNVPISESALKLTLPSGTGVHDELIDAIYTVP